MLFNSLAFAVFLPVGISFYTFQTLSYVIDVYMKAYMKKALAGISQKIMSMTS